MVPFIDYTNDNVMYSATQDGALYNSFNGGLSWNYIAFSISENGPWVTRWLQDPQHSNTLFAGYSNIWMSTNQGNSWSPISNFSSSNELVYALAIDPVNDKVLYTAWSDSIFGTTNQGLSWKNITANLPVSQASITGIALDPSNYNHAWVTFSGYVDSVKVYQTYNGGVTWKNISSGLPNLPVNCILFQKNSYSGIYAGTDAGVYYHDTVLNSWVPYNTGLPNVMINDLKYDASGALLAATYGRGVWTTPKYVDLTAVNTVTSGTVDAKVYPNPNNGQFTVQLANAPKPTRIEIYNTLGEKVYTGQLSASGPQTLIDMSNRPAGVYLYRILANDDALVSEGKLVVQK